MSQFVSDTNCFENIIGISRNECECFDLDPTISLSGFYLDEYEGLNLRILDSVNKCENKELFDMMAWAIEEATRLFKADVIRGINSSNRVGTIIPAWAGYIGDTSFKSTQAVSTLMAAHRQVMRPIRGGIMKVKRIGVLFSGAATFNLGLYDNLSNTALDIIEVTSVANKISWKTPDYDLNLPMYDKSGIIYYDWLYAVNQSNLPKDSAVHCGCGSTPLWTWPQCIFDVSQEKYNWSRWAMAAGVKGNDINQRNSWQVVTANNFGIIIDAEFVCNVYQTLCNGALDFDTNPTALEYARTIRIKAAELLIGRILLSTDLNGYSSQNAEILSTIAGNCIADYANALTDLIQYITEPDKINAFSDCYTCRASSGFRLSGIKS